MVRDEELGGMVRDEGLRWEEWYGGLDGIVREGERKGSEIGRKNEKGNRAGRKTDGRKRKGRWKEK